MVGLGRGFGADDASGSVCLHAYSGRGPSDHLPGRQGQVEATMNGPYLTVRGVSNTRHRRRVWKMWCFGQWVLARRSGPSEIYQDGSQQWWNQWNQP